MRKLWVLLLVALVACAPKANENTEKAQGDNLMRYAFAHGTPPCH